MSSNNQLSMNEFLDLSPTTKKDVLAQRSEQFFTQAFNWYVNAETLRRQKVPRARLAAHQRQIDESLANAQQALDSMQITDELMEEMLPLEHMNADLYDTSPVTLDSMSELVSLRDLEQARNGSLRRGNGGEEE